MLIHPMSYFEHLEQKVRENENFREVLYTTERSQLVMMTIPAGCDIGEEVHQNVEQVFFFQSGQGVAVVEGQETPVGPGDVSIISAGTKHNFKNTGSEPLKLATVYVPPNHIDKTVHRTKEDAMADEKDEAFGESVQ